MNKKDKWITRAVHVLRKVEFSGNYTDYDDPYDPDSAAWEEPCCPSVEPQRDTRRVTIVNCTDCLRRQRISNE